MRVRRKRGTIQVAQTGFESEALAILKQKGFRVTLPRVQVLRILALSHKPMTAYAIHQEIAAMGSSVDVVTVYRILDTLKSLHLVHHVGLTDGYVACRLEDTHESDSELIVCSDCGKVTELEIPQEILLRSNDQLAALGFEPKLTKLEILAKCPSCLDEPA